MKKQKGFSLIELLIVVAIILIIAAIAIPNLIRSKIAANESSAVASLRTINTAEVSYVNTFPGAFAALSSLGPGGTVCVPPPTSTASCLIDNLLAGGNKSGYTFSLAQGTATYTSTASPQSLSTGTRQFCSNQDLVLFYSTSSTGCAVGTNPL